ncbi:MAG: hypothetical protein Tsb002_19510 [Wenzhouxiangellaceae bacterium]
MKKIGFFSLILCALAMPLTAVQAQSLGGAFNRENAALLPANGTWWTPTTGPGRWGLQIEVQTGSFFPRGFLGGAIFTFDSDDPSIPTWYNFNEAYAYNQNWRQDGYIGRMDINLGQSANGTCLLCEDGTNAGVPVTPAINSARIVFKDSVNAELIVGGVTHQLVKSQWGDGPAGHLDELWEQDFAINYEATYPNTLINGSGTIRPIRSSGGAVTYEGMDGWDSLIFVLRVFVETSQNGSGFTDLFFQILVHKESNQYRLISPNLTSATRLEYKIFPQSRMVFEGRLIRDVGFDEDAEITSNFILITSPSMQPSGGQNRPWF